MSLQFNTSNALCYTPSMPCKKAIDYIFCSNRQCRVCNVWCSADRRMHKRLWETSVQCNATIGREYWYYTAVQLVHNCTECTTVLWRLWDPPLPLRLPRLSPHVRYLCPNHHHLRVHHHQHCFHRLPPQHQHHHSHHRHQHHPNQWDLGGAERAWGNRGEIFLTEWLAASSQGRYPVVFGLPAFKEKKQLKYWARVDFVISRILTKRSIWRRRSLKWSWPNLVTTM